MKTKIIPYVIYPFDLAVIYNAKYPQIEEYLKGILPDNTHHEINELFNLEIKLGRTAMFSSGQSVMVLNSRDKGVIAHEIFHAVEFLCNRVGFRLTRHSDEAYAYLIQYLTNEIYKK